MLTNHDLVSFCEAVYAASWVYWYGTCGYACTQSLYDAKARQYPSHYTASRRSGYLADIAQGCMCADCVGLIKGFFWMNGDPTGKNKYASNNCPDVSADGMIRLCAETGPIGEIPDIPGLLVWKSGHIGVYIGGGYTIEMRGFVYDCVKRKVGDGPWTRWGRLPPSMLAYVDGGTERPDMPEGDRILRNGDVGEDVQALQEALIQLGYDCGRWGADGDFGDATERAVRAYQRANGLDADGEVGPLTRAAMRKELAAQEAPGDPRHVIVVGGSYYIRSEPSTAGKILAVAHDGDVLRYAGETSAEGWFKVDYSGKPGWVSGKGGRLSA